MAGIPDESVYSRTSTAGRKRTLDDSTGSIENVAFDGTSDEESLQRSRKRMKKDDKLPTVVSPDDGLIINTTSPLHVGTPLAEDAPEQYTQQQPVSKAPSMSWNKGVQSGLRTSFGARSQPILSLLPSQGGDEDRGDLEAGNPSPAGPANLKLPKPLALQDTVHSYNDISESEIVSTAQPVDVNISRPPALPEASHFYNNISTGQSAGLNEPNPTTFQDGPSFHKDCVADKSHSRPDLARQAENPFPKFTKKQLSAFIKMPRAQKRALPAEEREAYELAIEERKEKQKSRKERRLQAKRPQQQDESSEAPGDAAQSSPIRRSKRLISKDAGVGELSLGTRPLAPPPGMPPFKQLNQKELDALSTEGRRKYDAAKRVDNVQRKQGIMAKQTAQVEEFIITEGWPLPEGSLLRQKVAGGLTYFPRKCTEAGLKFGNKNGWFRIREVFDEGKPIKVQNFSFNTFVKAFLIENKDNWDALTQKVLVGAFTHYINNLYSHILPLAGWLRPTAEAPDALALLDAQKEINRILTGASRSKVPMMFGGPNTVNQAASQVTSHEDHDALDESAQGVSTPNEKLPLTRFSLHGPTKPAKEATGDNDHITGVDSSRNSQGAENIKNATMLDFESKGATSLQATNTSTPVNVEDTESSLSDIEFNLQQKYFPSTDGNSVVRRCLACTRPGHSTLDCPALTCTLCGGSAGHSSVACPQKQRCGKCRECGHPTADCPEKLGRAKAEAVACDLCDSTDHVESGCHLIWRSFVPKIEEIRTVREVPIHCYTCGGSGHYGPECGLYQGRLLSGLVTWSRANAMKYIDPNSQNRAISAGVDYTIHSRQKRSFSIKGKANDPITFDDSEEDAQDFIRPKVNATTTQRGRIQFGDSSRSIAPPVNHQGQLRDSRLNFDRNPRTGAESARYERERTFSPPPRFYESDFHHNANDSYVPAGLSQVRGATSGRGRGRGGRGAVVDRGGRSRKPRIPKADRTRMQNEKNARNGSAL